MDACMHARMRACVRASTLGAPNPCMPLLCNPFHRPLATPLAPQPGRYLTPSFAMTPLELIGTSEGKAGLCRSGSHTSASHMHWGMHREPAQLACDPTQWARPFASNDA